MPFKRFNLSAIRGLLDSARLNFRRYQLAWVAYPALFGLLVLTGFSIVQLSLISVEKVRSFRAQLFSRDLQGIVGRLDTDERLVLNSNLATLLAELRELQPLVLPRQYYIKLPPVWSRSIPRSPPRNCFIQLPTSTATENEPSDQRDAIQGCAYFIENRSAGDFLFLNASFKDENIAPLRLGDTSFVADGVRMQVRLGSQSLTWWVFLQNPKEPNPTRYELTAFRVRPGVVERDKKVEGWAYAAKGENGVVNLLSRIDMKDLDVLHEEEEWPPKGWRDMQITLTRRDAAHDYQKFREITYKNQGSAQLSLASLAAPIFEAHGSVAIRKTDESGGASLKIPPGEKLLSSSDDGKKLVRFEDGDLIVRNHPLTTSVTIPGTDLVLTANHPGTVIQKEVWVTVLLLSALFVGGGAATYYFFVALLSPIGRLSRSAESAVSEATSKPLPYGDRSSEIGILSRAFEALLQATKTRAAREAKAGEDNLRVIGHEILSPIQALMNTVEEEHPARRYVERMVASVSALFGSAGKAGFQARQLDSREVDLAEYLHAASKNEWGGTVEDVKYHGPESGLICWLDPDALEDALTNVLNNASRFRAPGTPISVSLISEGREAFVNIHNLGTPISDQILPLVFEWKFSDSVRPQPSNQGIGLWVARNYIERMGGSIGLSNELDGVAVSIALPLIKKLPSE